MAKIPEDMSYKLIAKVGIISQLDYGDTKEANIIAWSGHRPMMDIRTLSPLSRKRSVTVS